MDIHDEVLKEEMTDVLCGRQLGKGETRKVFECMWNKELVIKVQEPNKRCNHMEYEIYCNIMGTIHEDYFAKVVHLSYTGRILVMERTRPPGPDYKWPIWVPEYMADLKKENFGLVKRKDKWTLVAHDYGNHDLFGKGLTKKLKKARWWSVHDRDTWDES